MALLQLSGATKLRDSKSADLLAQWMSSSPLIPARFSEPMEHTSLLALQSKAHAIRTYAESLFPAPYLIGLLLKWGAPRSGFFVVFDYDC